MRNALAQGHALYTHYRDLGRVEIDVNSIESSILTGGAKEALDTLARESQKCTDGKGAALYQRAMAGWIIHAGVQPAADATPHHLPICLCPDTAHDDLPSLGDIHAVRDIIGSFASEYIQSFATTAKGEKTQLEHTADMERIASTMADVFLGKQDGYNLQRDWNQSGGVDAFIAKESQIEETDPDARIRTLAYMMIADMRGIVLATDAGEISDQDAKDAIDGSLGGIASILVGIPFSVYGAAD